MRPQPWSFSSLEDFSNCPRSFHEVRILKSVPKQPETAEQLWGTRVHKWFEERQLEGKPLPAEVAHHEPFMVRLAKLPGDATVERKVALTKDRTPTGFFGKDVWWRGVIDFQKVDTGVATVVDYKTGKQKDKPDQLILFALYTFAEHPRVQIVNTYYYWTQTAALTQAVYTRDQISSLWAKFVPTLRQYVEAFKTDTWQPRPSGLCHGWCAVTHCEHWKPKKAGR
jgi:RecB family exonuclease